MANDLTISPPKWITSLPPWLASSVTAMSQGYPPKIPARLALTTERRRVVSGLVENCDRSLVPATKREIGTIVMRLLADYPADNSNPAIEQARAQNWADALEGLPAW